MSAEPRCSSYLRKTALMLPRVRKNAQKMKYCGYWCSNRSSHDSYSRHIFIGEKVVMWHSFEKVGATRLSQHRRAQWRTERSAGHHFRYDVLIPPGDIRPAEHPVIVMSLSDHSGTPEWIKRSRFEIRVKPSGCRDRGDKNTWTDSKSGGTTSIITLFWSISRATLVQSEQTFLLSTPLKRQTYLLNITYEKHLCTYEELRVRTTENRPPTVQEQWGSTFRASTAVQWVPLPTYVRTQMCFSVISKWQNQFISARFSRAIRNLNSF